MISLQYGITYFWKASDKNTAKCKSCHQILKTAGSSTSSMRNHLRVIHSNDLKLTKDHGKKISTPSCSSIISSTDTSRTSDQTVTKTQSQEDVTHQSKKKTDDGLCSKLQFCRTYNCRNGCSGWIAIHNILYF